MIGIVSAFLYVTSLGLPFNPEVALVIFGLASVVAVTLENSRRFYIKSPIFIALIAFLIATALSILGSVDIYRSFTISLSLLPATLLFYLIVDRFDIFHVRLLYIFFPNISLLISTVVLLTAWNNPQGHPSNWIAAANLPHLLVPNDLLLLAIIAPFSLAVIQSNSGYALRSLSIISLLSSSTVIILFQSPIALLVLVATSIATIALLWPNLFLKSIIVFLIAGISLDSLNEFELINKLLDPKNWGSRIPLWLAAWHMLLDAPLFGQGPNAFAIIGENYLDKLILPSWIYIDQRYTPWVHNLYLELLAERGILGISTFMFLLGTAWHVLWRTYKYNDFGEVRNYSIGIITSLFGIALGGLFELSFVRHWFVILLFTLLAITQVLSKNENGGRILKNEQRTIC